MPRKLGGTDDFKPKKPNRIGDYRPGNRFSFRMPGDKPRPDTECGKVDIPKRPPNLDPNSDVGRPDGYAVLYSPEQIENYKKQYPRFEAALSLVPDGIQYQEDNQIYLFCSKNSPTGYWQVTLTPSGVVTPDYYIAAGKPLLILCPIPYQINQVESNAENFVWTQLEGGRLAFVDPDNTIDPVLHILDDVRDNRPIRFKVAIADYPDINDTLIIYTTPTETHTGIGFTQTEDNSLKVSAIPAPAPAPIYLHKAYLMSDRGLTWNPPSINSEYVVGYSIQQNTTGQYIDVQSFGTDTAPIFVGLPGGYYRIKILFSSFGLDYESPSDPLIYPTAFTPPTVIIDDSTNGLSFNCIDNAILDLPLSVQKLEFTDVENGLSFSSLNNDITDIPLSTQRYDLPIDTAMGASFAFIKSEITDIPLGGVIIG